MTPREKAFRSHGFILIITLTLMTLITLLLVSMLTWKQSDMGNTSVNYKQASAQQNALLGLKMAMGELQRKTGPDQRITAPARILALTKENLVDFPSWTGVWASKEMGGRADDFKGWLISGQRTQTQNPELPLEAQMILEGSNSSWQPNSDDWIRLVGPGSVEDQNDAVIAPLKNIEQQGRSIGRYAFWVGEEATKARINIHYATPIDDSINKALQPGVHWIDQGELDFLRPGSDNLERIQLLTNLRFMQLDNAGETPNPADRRYFHDLSTSSVGLLTDTRNGGMRRDLTHLFEYETAFENYFGSVNHDPSNPYDGITFRPSQDEMSAVDGDINLTQFGSPNWSILRDFYKLKDNPGVASGAIRPEGLIHGNSTPEIAYNPHVNHRYHINNQLSPVLSWYQVGIGVNYMQESVDPDLNLYRFFPRIRFRFIVALFNPYDIALERQNRYHLRIAEQVKIALRIDGKDEVSFRLQEILPVRSEEEALEAAETGGPAAESPTNFDFRDISADFLPGETRFFSIEPEGAGFDVHYEWRHQRGQRSLRPQLIPDIAYYIDPTEDEHLATASLRGSTSARSRQASPYFGLTNSEREDLQWIGHIDDEPGFEVRVSYDPFDDDPNSNPESLGRIILSRNTNNPVIQFFYLPYQQHPDIAPRTSFPPRFDRLTDSVAPTIRDYGFRLRTPLTPLPSEDAKDRPHRIFIDANLRPFAASTPVDGHINGEGLALISGWEGIGFEEWGVTMLDPEIALNSHPIYGDRYSGYFGSSRRQSDGTLATILFHVPREPLISLGTLQHALMGRYSRHPSYITGNSYAIARLPLHSTAQGRIFDWSYIINRDLWDSYYFSTIPQGENLINDANTLNNTKLQEILNRERYLPNPRLSFDIPEWLNVNASMLINPDDINTPGLVAALQRIEGPFNVNSVSVNAWKAFLASNSGVQVPLFNLTNGQILSEESEENIVFFRTPVNFNNGVQTNDPNPLIWSSHRTLSYNELNDLAEAMVEEVLARGPFSSIGDFINRRLEGPDEQRQRGALQAALDKSINSRLPTGTFGEPSGSNLAIPDQETAQNGDNVHSPEDRVGTGGTGWLSQADLLQVLGPLLAVRSDTFTIRSYGDWINPQTDEVEARAWCEVVVQRVAEPLNNQSPPTIESLIVAPHEMGRKFRIISFRWLEENEI